MTHPTTLPVPIHCRAQHASRRLRRRALAVALAAAGLVSTSAWALTDACTTPTTTISTSVAGADDKYCQLATGESVVVNAGISFNASGIANPPAVTVIGTPAGSITNAGTIYADDDNSILVSGGTGVLSGGINNQAGAVIDGAEGIEVGSGGTIQNGIVNNGTITAHGNDDCDAIRVLGTGSIVGGIFNRGAITPCSAFFHGIVNGGSIDSIDNLQGGGTPLTLRTNVPGTYRIIVDSLASYGKLSATTPAGTMAFEISPGSTLQVGTYPDVLIGVPQVNLTGALSGTFGPFLWELVLANPSGVWDLVVTLPQPVRESTPVPALPVWGGALLAALLGAFGALRLRRRR